MTFLPHRRFSHPVSDVPTQSLSINEGGGSIDKITSSGPRGSQCSDFLFYAKVGMFSGSVILWLDGQTYRLLLVSARPVALAGALLSLGHNNINSVPDGARGKNTRCLWHNIS